MHLYWKNNVTNTMEQIFYSSSSNGTTWTAPVSLFTGPVGMAVSPAVRYADGIWYMWSVNLNFAPGDGWNTLERRTASAPGGPWSSPVNCTVTPAMPTGREVWHPHMQRYGSQWICVMNDCQHGTNGGNGDQYFMTSTDGLTWTRGDSVLQPRANGTDYTRLYRASLVPTYRDGHAGFDMWYGTVNASNEWWIFRTRLSLDHNYTPNFGYGTWNIGLGSGSNGETTDSARFYAQWKDGLCIVHLDAKHSATTNLGNSKLVGYLPANCPRPLMLAEVMVQPSSTTAPNGVTAFVQAASNEVKIIADTNQRVIARIVYFY